MLPANRGIPVALIVSGKYHNIDFARLELLKLLAEDDRFRVRVFEDYSNLPAIQNSEFLVSYTCDVIPSLEQQEALRGYIAAGGRWFALHGTNSILRFLEDKRVDTPRWAPHFMRTLGSTFVAHPPVAAYRVDVATPEHPLTMGIESFETTDEQYLVESYGELQVLLDTHFEGMATGFVEDRWASARHPVFYINAIEKGAVLYLTLGHCRGHYDMQPLMDFYPHVENGSWDLPVFYDLLRRGIRWCSGRVSEP